MFRTISLAAVSALTLAACATTDDGVDTASTTTSTAAVADTPERAPVTIGGAEMLPTNTIVENASLSNDHKTLVSAIQTAGLVETLSGPGPLTVFAPTDAAFSNIPADTLTALMQPQMKAQLTDILTYHVVSGTVGSADLIEMITAGGGTATVDTVNGATLTATLENGIVRLADARGGAGYVEIADAYASNGVVHQVNGVLLPPVPETVAPAADDDVDETDVDEDTTGMSN